MFNLKSIKNLFNRCTYKDDKDEHFPVLQLSRSTELGSCGHIKHQSQSQFWWLTGCDGAGFFSCFSCQLSIFVTKSSELTSWAGHRPTGCMIELTASPRSSCSLISQHRVSSTGHQVHRWLGGSHCYQNCVRNTTLWPAAGLCSSLHTLLHIIDNIGSMLRGWENLSLCPLQHLRW